MLTNMGQGHAWNNVVVVNLMVIKTHLHLFFPIFMQEDFIISNYPQKRWASYIVCTVYIIELITLICANAYHTPFGTLVSYFINIWHSFKPFSHYMMYRVRVRLGKKKKTIVTSFTTFGWGLALLFI